MIVLLSRTKRVLLSELAALAAAAGLAVVAVAHILSTDRAAILLSDGDSVLFELVHQSIRDGLPFHWVMSAVLFLFPEAPTYLVIRSLSASPQQAIITNAVLNLVVLYGLVRATSAILRTPRHRGILPALVGYGAVILCILLETTASRNSFELASLFLVGTYYYGTILGLFASVALVGWLLSRHDRPLGRGVWIAGSAVVLLALLSTTSNPLYGLWVAAPIGFALLVIGLLTPVRWMTVIRIIALLAVGTLGGLLARIPLAPYFSPAAWPYVHPDRRLEALLFYPSRLLDLAETPLGAVEVVVVVLLVVSAITGLIVALRRRDQPVLMFAAVVGAATPVILYTANVVLGTEAERYLQPLFFSPVLSLVVLCTVAAERVRAPSRAPVIAGTAAAAAILIAVVPSTAAVATVVTSDYDRVDCLEDWIDDRDVTGAGLFWDIRDLEAYGDESVQLVQVVGTFAAFPWLINLAEYYDADPSYLVVQDPSWLADIESTLGEPAAVIDCPTYQIVDFEGTPGAEILAATVSDTGTAVARQNGFLAP